jgi:1-acyl-sn-glycerol-3-phosphate acyltransferase
MNEFDDIRHYYDSEVVAVLSRLAKNREFIDTLLSIKYPRLRRWAPWLVRPVISYTLRSSFSKMRTVSHLHSAIRESFGNLLVEIGSILTVTGLEKLDRNTPYLFISNHRDIAMDPAFVNVALLDDDRDSVRIAIGDNLLTKQFVSDLARVNKSFVVKRSVVGRREKMTALMQLSRYIRSSLAEDKSSVWIAQREGRAKNGMDKTEPALLKMLTFSKQKDQTFGNALQELNVVPVAISYEFDPLDAEKGLELLEKRTNGSYEKNEHEDFFSIYQGIVGRKGAVHVSFGEPLVADYTSADDAALAMDQQIISNYKLHATNLLAYYKLYKSTNETDIMLTEIDCDWVKITHEFNQRINSIAPEAQKIVLEMYANPVSQKIARRGSL